MPRLARLDAPGVLHHVMGRGIERRKIFINKKDRNDFISRLAELAEGNAMDIYAWALLPNHFHILCKTKMRPLSSSMRKVLTGYVVNFNKRHNRHGHLFQNRYKSIVCEEDVYLLELVRYIHLNLIRAGMVKSIKELNRSPWSGHSALIGYVKRDWQDTGYVLSSSLRLTLGVFWQESNVDPLTVLKSFLMNLFIHQQASPYILVFSIHIIRSLYDHPVL